MMARSLCRHCSLLWTIAAYDVRAKPEFGASKLDILKEARCVECRAMYQLQPDCLRAPFHHTGYRMALSFHVMFVSTEARGKCQAAETGFAGRALAN
jgi:hypothetical protein